MTPLEQFWVSFESALRREVDKDGIRQSLFRQRQRSAAVHNAAYDALLKMDPIAARAVDAQLRLHVAIPSFFMNAYPWIQAHTAAINDGCNTAVGTHKYRAGE